MGDEALTQAGAWAAYDGWRQDERVQFLDEPPGLEHTFRSLTGHSRRSTKDWADSYMTAFAVTAGLILVSFDRALERRPLDVVLLEP